MKRRPPVWPAFLTFAALGLTLGLADFRAMAAFPLARFEELQRFPHPRSVLWLAGLRGPAEAVAALERPLTAIAVALLFAALVLLGRLLNPHFQLLKPPERNPGRGVAAHLELRALARTAVGALVSFWLLGAFGPLAAAFAAGAQGERAAALLGGVPVWCVLLLGPDAGRSAFPLAGAVSAALLGALLWALWAPGGLVAPGGPAAERAARPAGLLRALLRGAGAGLVASPALLYLYQGRFWLAMAAPTFSLADRAGWLLLLVAAAVAPAAAAGALALVAAAFRTGPSPSAVAGRSARAATAAALGGALLLAAGLHTAGRRALARLDLDGKTLQQALQVTTTPQQRFALLLTGDGRARYSVTPDGTREAPGAACLTCYRAWETAREFLERRRWRTALAFSAYVHLHDCAALGWDSVRALEIDLTMLERAPTPVAARLLRERLANCPVTPETRRILDHVADPRRFVWPEPEGRRWLGAAYLRFGDVAQARRFLLTAGLSPAELRPLLAGASPLADGVLRGRVRLRGRPVPEVRVGVVPLRKAGEMLGLCRPFAWRQVLAAGYTDAAGRFELRNLPEGRYLLVLTGGGIGRDPGIPVVLSHPGVVTVDRFRAVQELRPFDIRFVRPTGAPARGAETTVRRAPARREEGRPLASGGRGSSFSCRIVPRPLLELRIQAALGSRAIAPQSV